MGNKPNTLRLIASFAIIYFVWGSTFLGIRFALESFPPFLLAGIRFSTAGAILLMLAQFKSAPRLTPIQFKTSLIPAFFMIFVGYGCLTWSEQYIPSGMAALIIATIPLWMVLFEWIILHHPPHWLTLLGLPVGLLGVYLLSDLDNSLLIRSDNGMTLFKGVFILTLAAMAWGLGSIYARRIPKPVSLTQVAGVQMISGGLGLLIVGTVSGEWGQLMQSDVSARSVYAIVYLILIGSVLAYSAYLWLLQVCRPAKVGTYAYFNPVVALFLGAVLADEPVTMAMAAGGGLILCSMLMVNLSRES